MIILALLVSFIFPLAVYFFLKSAHKDNKAYQQDCWKLLWNGWLLGFPVFGFSLLCKILFSITRIDKLFPIADLLFDAFVLKAFSEELMKYILANKIISRRHQEVSFLDLMAYTTISAAGFEMMEMVVYVFSTNIPQVLVRGISNMHAAFGMIMGFIIAFAYKKNWKKPVLWGILIPTLIHGTYDVCLDESVVDLFGGYVALAIAFACLLINIANVFFMIKARKDPYYNDPLFPESADDSEENQTLPEEKAAEQES